VPGKGRGNAEADAKVVSSILRRETIETATAERRGKAITTGIDLGALCRKGEKVRRRTWQLNQMNRRSKLSTVRSSVHQGT